MAMCVAASDNASDTPEKRNEQARSLLQLQHDSGKWSRIGKDMRFVERTHEIRARARCQIHLFQVADDDTFVPCTNDFVASLVHERPYFAG